MTFEIIDLAEGAPRPALVNDTQRARRQTVRLDSRDVPLCSVMC